jgi:hypothetical protein
VAQVEGGTIGTAPGGCQKGCHQTSGDE